MTAENDEYRDQDQDQDQDQDVSPMTAENDDYIRSSSKGNKRGEVVFGDAGEYITDAADATIPETLDLDLDLDSVLSPEAVDDRLADIKKRPLLINARDRSNPNPNSSPNPNRNSRRSNYDIKKALSGHEYRDQDQDQIQDQVRVQDQVRDGSHFASEERVLFRMSARRKHQQGKSAAVIQAAIRGCIAKFYSVKHVEDNMKQAPKCIEYH